MGKEVKAQADSGVRGAPPHVKEPTLGGKGKWQGCPGLIGAKAPDRTCKQPKGRQKTDRMRMLNSKSLHY